MTTSWTCEKCGTHYAGVTIPWFDGGTKRVPPPPVGQCPKCAEEEHKAHMAQLQGQTEGGV